MAPCIIFNSAVSLICLSKRQQKAFSVPPQGFLSHRAGDKAIRLEAAAVSLLSQLDNMFFKNKMTASSAW